MAEWEKNFESNQYNKLAFMGSGAENWKANHNQAIKLLFQELFDRISPMLNRLSDDAKVYEFKYSKRPAVFGKEYKEDIKDIFYEYFI